MSLISSVNVRGQYKIMYLINWDHWENWWPHQESNLDLKFRKLLFYPLNYEAWV